MKDNEFEESFGQFIKRLRESKSLTITEVAEKAGISHSHLSRIENGERNAPKVQTLQKLSKILNCPFDIMMERAGYIEYDKATLRHFVQTLNDLIKERDISYEKVGESVGLSQFKLIQIGAHGLPPMDKINKIAEFFSVSADYLLGQNERSINTDEEDDVDSIASIPEEREYKEFKKFLNNPEYGLFFRDYLEAPEERKRELMQFWRFIQEKEKDRKPGDYQGEK
ncbi:transcriptional regulator with XRE-family HTH domain [Paenibacillus sp. 1182]|uniref:helix-turn-helix transcriptional regulator n=1 Tax=Paenibacillus sp. 1182 TaxID=2806565 RepID=UPI001AE51382|nr:helix-turn-helix transcriptional regulator [Paenibacillus sp. 1182]MBP1312273.1 transcriptional regulator with XRE-family HTH domain [Paenibacillus sp. 1182]